MPTREKIVEALKDRQDYRQTLIHRMEELQKKIDGVEKQIKQLRAA